MIAMPQFFKYNEDLELKALPMALHAIAMRLRSAGTVAENELKEYNPEVREQIFSNKILVPYSPEHALIEKPKAGNDDSYMNIKSNLAPALEANPVLLRTAIVYTPEELGPEYQQFGIEYKHPVLKDLRHVWRSVQFVEVKEGRRDTFESDFYKGKLWFLQRRDATTMEVSLKSHKGGQEMVALLKYLAEDLGMIKKDKHIISTMLTDQETIQLKKEIHNMKSGKPLGYDKYAEDNRRIMAANTSGVKTPDSRIPR